MNTLSSSHTRRWLLSLLATRPGRRLLHTTLITTLALNLGTPIWAAGHSDIGTWRQSQPLTIPNLQSPISNHPSSIQNPKSKIQNPYAVPAVQTALHQLGLPLPAPPSTLFAPDNFPTGSQFQVNNYTSSRQVVPAVGMDSDGDFVVVWRSFGSTGSDTSSYSIQAQRYNSAGVPQDSQFDVNTYTTGAQGNPAVALDSDGDFVVVWEGNTGGVGDLSSYSVQGQRYNSAGVPQGSQFQINTYTTSAQRRPVVALDTDGDFVVVWESNGSSAGDVSNLSVQGQRYDSAGVPQGGNFQVNTYTTSQQRFPAVALDSDGDFVVVWQSNGSSGGDTSVYSIQGQRYNSAGTLQGSNFQVNTYTTGDQDAPALAIDSNGNFVIVWESGGNIQGRRYNAAGLALTNEFQINSYTTDSQSAPAVSRNNNGDFVVVWESNGSSTGSPMDTSSESIQGQRFNNAGTAQNVQFQVNSYTTNTQFHSVVALDSDGDFIVVWESYGSNTGSPADTIYQSIQGQRFTTAATTQVNTYTTNNQRFPAVALDSDGDFVIVWQSLGSSGSDTSAYSIQGQRYSSVGTPQGGQFQVNSYTTSNQHSPSVALDSDGDFVVAWTSFGSASPGPSGGPDIGTYSIQARRFNSAGTPQGSQFQVNSYTTDQQREPSVALDNDGDFVVVWNSFEATDDTGSYSIQGQRYNSLGAAAGSQFRVNTYTTSNQRYPAVAIDSSGNFVVVWNSFQATGTDTGSYSIQAQSYNPAGVAQGSEFQVNTYTTSQQTHPAVARDSDGDFVVVWQSNGSSSSGSGPAGADTNLYSIQGQRYNSAGTPQGSQFQVNTYTTGQQRFPAIALDADGDFVIAWPSDGSSSDDNAGQSIQARAFTQGGLPLWGEFQVNTYTTGNQAGPAVALDSSGDFVLAWHSDGSPGNDNSNESIQARQFDLGQSDYQVNSYTNDDQRFPSVALDSDGDFVIAWQSYGSPSTDTIAYSIHAQRFDSNGLPQGNNFQVNTYTTNEQRYPSVAMDSDGDFVIIWHSWGSLGNDNNYPIDYSIQAQRYNSAGIPQGNQFQVNTYTTGNQDYPSVAMDSDGDFVVVWFSDGSSGTDTGTFSIQGQRYNSAGTPLGGEFQVNTYSTAHQRDPAVSLDSDGDFVVTWQSNGSSSGPAGADTYSYSIQGQRYNSAGTPQGSQFQVNTYTTGGQRYPSVSLDSDGDFVVVWFSYGSSSGPAGADTSSFSIQAQRYNSAGTAQGTQFQVNTYTTAEQHYPTVSLDSDGDFVVVWHSDGSSGSDTDWYSIQAQRYNSAGIAQGTQFQVNNYTTERQNFPAVALDSDGDFVIAWESRYLTSPPFSNPSQHGEGLENDDLYAIAAARFTALAGPQPTALTLSSSSLLTPHSSRSPLFALLSTLLALLTATYLRLRRHPR